MSDEPKFRAIVYVPGAYICESDHGEYHEDLFELIEEDSIEKVVRVAAAAVPLREELAPSLWIPDLDLAGQAVAAFAKIMTARAAVQEKEQAKYSARAKAFKLRMRIAELESGEELERLRQELAEAESASLAVAGEE